MDVRHYIILLAFLFFTPFMARAQGGEEELRAEAEKLFQAENYDEAFTKYSQLLALNLQSPEYNYRFGACQLFTSHDKEQALKYLKFAVESDNAPNLSHYYYGLGLHLNYRFDRAMKEYEKYQVSASKKEPESKLVAHNISQCKSGIDLVSNFTDISVIQKEKLPRTEFYRNYDLSEFGGKIMVKPEDFMSDEDKNRDAKFLMYFQQNADYIYYASYSDKNATGKDLFVIQKLPTGEWSKPTKLSSVINTEFDEDYPFIHPDGNVLYFASKGHNSMGGYDIFKSTRKGDGTWTQPTNLEFAINTPWDDFLFISDKDENIAWFASNRETNSKQVSVYKIGIQRIPLDLTLIKGTFEAEGSKKAKITVEDMVQNKVIGVFESERQFGEYLLDLRGSGKYKFTIEAEESNSIHTGMVEIPREKGLKQFRQEMTLVDNGGKEQLQIINHFDEPLAAGENLLTADILRKQANLSVNSSDQDIQRSTEILDDPEASAAAAKTAGMTNDEKIAIAELQLSQLKDDAVLLNKEAALLYGRAQDKAKLSDPSSIAEAAIAAELASAYKKEAESRSAAATRMEGTLSTLKQNNLEEAAFNAQYHQVSTSAANFKPVSQFDEKLTSEFEKRQNPSVALYESKEAELNELNEDLKGIDEEIVYYETEIGNTKDQAVKDELQLQKEDAQKARPAKVAAIDNAKIEFSALKTQKANAENYAELAATLIASAGSGAGSINTTVSASEISAVQSTLSLRAEADPALLAFVAPEKVKDVNEKAVADAKTQDGNETAKSTTNETPEKKSASSNLEKTEAEKEAERAEVAAINAQLNGTTPENAKPASASSEKTEAEKEAERAEVAAINAQLNGTSTGTNSTTNSNETTVSSESSESAALNNEIRTIEGGVSQPEIIQGDYASILQNRINEASNAEDPIIAESEKAEIYDQWVENLTYRIDSLETAQSNVSSTAKKLEITNEIVSLEGERQAKEDLAMQSYEQVAVLSDQQALSSSNVSPNNAISPSSPNTPESVAATGEAGSPTILETPPVASAQNPESATTTNLEAGGAATPNASTSTEKPIETPPVTAEILASEEVPPTVLMLNASYEERLNTELSQVQDPLEKAKLKAELNQSWADELQQELIKIGAQIKSSESIEEKNVLERLAANLSQMQVERQNKATDLKKAVQGEERELAMADEKKTLQNKLYEYTESYNSQAFVQIQDQVDQIENSEQRRVQSEVLNRNWIVAIKNEELKTENQIKNSDDPKLQSELKEKLIALTAEKLYVQATLDSLKIDAGTDGPAAPKSVVIKGSERFEGYKPVESPKPQEYNANAQSSYAKIDALQSEIVLLETNLAEAKKKDKPTAELALEKKQNELALLQQASVFYEASEPKITNVEGLILQMEAGDPTASQIQMQRADKLNDEAERLTAEANAKRLAADAVKKKKLKEPAQKEARTAEHVALMKREQADMETKLAGEMMQIEARALAQNFIIPPGEANKLPVVTKSLNPTEQEDVKKTEQFQAYNVQRMQADSVRAIALKLEAYEAQLNQKAQEIMLRSSTGVGPNGEQVDRVRTAEQAFVFYDKADSISGEAAQLNRQAAFIENKANETLLKNPEEVYNSIIAYYNTDSTIRVAAPTNEEIAALAIENADAQVIEEDDSEPESTSATSLPIQPQKEEKFQLTPPKQNDESLTVPQDVLTNTIFEMDKTASKSFYSNAKPIPVDQPLPTGIVYKVQIGAFRNPISPDAFKGIKPIVGESTGTGLIRYQAGAFKDFASADFAKDEIREIGYPDAFVVAFLNGKRISVAEARSGNVTGAAAPAQPRPNTGNNQNAVTVTQSTGGTSTAGQASQTQPKKLPGNSVVKQGDLVIRDVANQGGTFFTVQVGVYSKPVTSAEIYNITPLNQENLPNGTYRYTTGVYKDEATATQAKDEVVSLGISDAFVTAYKTGARTTVETAREELGGSASTPPPGPSANYRLFLGSFVGKVPLTEAAVILSIDSKRIEKVNNGDGSSSYFYGSYRSQAEADKEAAKLIGKGLTQAKSELH